MSNTNVSSEILRLQMASRIIYGHVGIILIALGTIGNLLNIALFLRFKILRQMPNSTFLLTAFVACIVQLWTTRFSRSLFGITNINLLAISTFYCQFRWVIGRMSSCVAMTCICMASIDRFLITSRNIRYHHIFTVQRACLIVTTISIIYLSIFMPLAIYYSEPLCTSIL